MRRQGASTVLWVAGGALFLAAVGLAAMTPLGPFVFGWRLMWCELATRRFRRVLAPVDLAAPGTPLGEALARLDAAVDRVMGEGREQSLPLRSEGYFFEEPTEPARRLNQRLALVLVARAQLAHEYRTAADAWATAISRRNMVRLGTLVFVGVVLLLCVYEPIGAATLFFGREPFTLARLAVSGAGVLLALSALSLLARAGAPLLLEGSAEFARARPCGVRSYP